MYAQNSLVYSFLFELYVCWHLFHTESDELAFIFDSISNLVEVRARNSIVFQEYLRWWQKTPDNRNRSLFLKSLP